MFHDHNIPQKTLDDISKFLEIRNKDSDLPECLLESSRKISSRYAKAATLEEQKSLVKTEFDAVVKENNLTITDWNILKKFEDAVRENIKQKN